MENKSIYSIIRDSLVDGKLPNDFSLTSSLEIGELTWIDGAFDGVSMYHMGTESISEEALNDLSDAFLLTSENEFDAADVIVADILKQFRAIGIIDSVQSHLVEHQNEYNLEVIYRYSLHLMMDSPDIESVKFGMILQELYNIDEEYKDVVRVLGKSDEFTLFSIYLVRKWENGQMEILDLAKNVKGWGRIHAVEFIEPDNEEIKHWLLTEGTKNEIIPAYSGLACYQKADVESILGRESITYEEMAGTLYILAAMVDEGPVRGISELDDPEAIVVKALTHASKHLPLQPREANAVNMISDWQEEFGEDDNPKIESLVDEILCDKETRELIFHETQMGRYTGLAKSIGLT